MSVLRTRGSEARRRASDAAASAHMRVSDAERGAVADRLAQHYGDGRLDQAELDERLGRAMSAKTQADLSGLCADLPDIDGSAVPARAAARQPRGSTGPARTGAGRPRGRVLPVVLIVVLIVVGWRLLTHWFAPWYLFWPGAWLGWPWLWIGLLAFLWLRYGRRR